MADLGVEHPGRAGDLFVEGVVVGVGEGLLAVALVEAAEEVLDEHVSQRTLLLDLLVFLLLLLAIRLFAHHSLTHRPAITAVMSIRLRILVLHLFWFSRLTRLELYFVLHKMHVHMFAHTPTPTQTTIHILTITLPTLQYTRYILRRILPIPLKMRMRHRRLRYKLILNLLNSRFPPRHKLRLLTTIKL